MWSHGHITTDAGGIVRACSNDLLRLLGDPRGRAGHELCELEDGTPSSQQLTDSIRLMVRSSEKRSIRFPAPFVMLGPSARLIVEGCRVMLVEFPSDFFVSHVRYRFHGSVASPVIFPMGGLTVPGFCGMLSASSGALPMSAELSLKPRQRSVPVSDAIHDYLIDHEIAENGDGYITNTRRSLKRAMREMSVEKIEDISEDKVRVYMIALKGRGLSAKTRRHYWDDLDRFFVWCFKKGLIPENYVRNVPKAKKVRSRARMVPTDADIVTLAGSLQGRKQAKDRWCVYVCAANQPLRWKVWKLLRPEWIHIDGPKPHFRIPGEYIDPVSNRTVIVMKNRCERVEWLTTETVAVLKWHREEFGWGRRVFQSVPKPEMFTRDLVRAGISREDGTGATMSFHSLKHYASNRRMRLGWTVEERKQANDHSDDRMTLDIYTDPKLVKVAERTASMPGILPSQVLEGLALVKKVEPLPRKSLDEQGYLSDTGGVQETALRTPNSNIPGRFGESAADVSAVATSPEQSGAIAERSAALRSGPVQRVAQLGSAAGLGPAGRPFKSDHADFYSAGRKGELVGAESRKVGTSGSSLGIGPMDSNHCPCSDAATYELEPIQNGVHHASTTDVLAVSTDQGCGGIPGEDDLLRRMPGSLSAAIEAMEGTKSREASRAPVALEGNQERTHHQASVREVRESEVGGAPHRLLEATRCDVVVPEAPQRDPRETSLNPRVSDAETNSEVTTWDGQAEAVSWTKSPNSSCPSLTESDGPQSPESSSTSSRARTATPSTNANSGTLPPNTNGAIPTNDGVGHRKVAAPQDPLVAKSQPVTLVPNKLGTVEQYHPTAVTAPHGVRAAGESSNGTGHGSSIGIGRGVAQLVEHQTHHLEVDGSSPFAASGSDPNSLADAPSGGGVSASTGASVSTHAQTPAGKVQDHDRPTDGAPSGAPSVSSSSLSSPLGSGHIAGRVSPPTAGLEQCVARPAILDDSGLAESLLDEADRFRLQGKVRFMRNAARAAAMLLLAGAAGSSLANPLRALWDDGFKCYAAHCVLASTVTQCIACCAGWCYDPKDPSIEDQCQEACTGGRGDKVAKRSKIIRELAQDVGNIATLSPTDRNATVYAMTHLAATGEAELARRINVLSADLPLESERQQVQAAYKRRRS